MMDMDALASQIISLNSLSNGRDKQFRLIQYLSRLLWTSMNDGPAVDRLKRLEETLSTSRKLLQLGRFMDTLNSARSSVLLDDKVLNLTLTMSKVSNSLFILSDNILWAGRVGVLDIDRAKWFRTSFKLWLYSIIMNLVRDLYEINKLIKKSSSPVTRVKETIQSKLQKRTSTSMSTSDGQDVDPGIELSRRVIEILISNKPLTIDLVKNVSDLFIPLNGLNHISLPPQLIGLLGTVSSTCALLQVMYPSLRLNPN